MPSGGERSYSSQRSGKCTVLPPSAPWKEESRVPGLLVTTEVTRTALNSSRYPAVSAAAGSAVQPTAQADLATSAGLGLPRKLSLQPHTARMSRVSSPHDPGCSRKPGQDRLTGTISASVPWWIRALPGPQCLTDKMSSALISEKRGRDQLVTCMVPGDVLLADFIQNATFSK